jgi:catechol 2,3-dioxygenase-like lactoylglutathione lyase family enzyme
MKPVISDLVDRYERGGLSRRELIQGLSLLVAAAALPAVAADAAPTPMTPTGIDHVSVRVRDLTRSAAFYASLFGLKPLSEDKPHNILRLGADKKVIVSLRQDLPHGQIDHFGVGVKNFDKATVTRDLEKRGLKPQEDWEYGFHVRDPDGVPVQFMPGT